MFKKTILSAAVLAALSGTAFAADLPTQKGPPAFAPPPPIFTWTGVYIGGQVGYQWGRTYNSTPLGGVAYSPNGVTGGAHIGYNYQFAGPFVVGLEGDVDGLGYRGSAVTGLGFTSGSREDVDGSVRGRVGYSWDRALIYATGGVAFGDFRLWDSLGDGSSSMRVGWTAGGGIEYAIDNNWSVRAEYRYTSFGSYSTFAPLAGTTISSRNVENKVMAGFSYKFDLMGPVLAKY